MKSGTITKKMPDFPGIYRIFNRAHIGRPEK